MKEGVQKNSSPFELRWNNMTFIPTVHKFDVKPAIFIEDSTELD